MKLDFLKKTLSLVPISIGISLVLSLYSRQRKNRIPFALSSFLSQEKEKKAPFTT